MAQMHISEEPVWVGPQGHAWLLPGRGRGDVGAGRKHVAQMVLLSGRASSQLAAGACRP